ncbi:Asp-tRNA(Asn)/Glu-tRNA(Gln) amidotransferase subunit GatA [Candidatus Gracilibacteria bacterium 28_42_T64]|nr:Asp-tRNA(Asn)/Glu-tRNA(Gln) amidotransferase subunit GatA [Candidatus Gracilibacteria bacterium 28_42_T64]
MNFKDLSLEEIILKIKSGETTNKEVFDYFQTRIEKYDDTIQSYNYINTDGLKSDNDSILAGAPIAVKDIFCEKGIPTTCSSNMLKDFVPPYDATVIKNLNEAGMSSLGKVNMDEFAMGSTTESSATKKTFNPWGTNRIPGGSSGGSAACVAAGLAPAALGTDTGGSIRQPASVCGVVGFKPSYGRNSRFGAMAMASSLDCPGTLTKTVKDSAILYEVMNGHDEKENTSLPGKDIIDSKIWSSKDLKGMKIGVPKEYFEEGLDDGVRQVINKAIEKMKDLGAEVKEISLPMTKYAIATYYIVMPAELSTNLSRYDGIRYGHVSDKAYEGIESALINSRSEGFGDEAKRRIMLGSYVLSAGYYDAYYKKATQVRTLIMEDFDKAFSEVDAIISPVSPSVAWKIGEKIDDPVKMYLSDAYTIPASLAGLPGISVPAGFAESEDAEKEKLPVGIQILTANLQEEKLFEIAHVYEQATGFGKINPKGFED